MKKALLHPSLLVNIRLSSTVDETNRVVSSLIAWNRARESKAYDCHMSETTCAALAQDELMQSLGPTLNRAPRQEGDTWWTPKELKEILGKLMHVVTLDGIPGTNEILEDCASVALSPNDVESVLPSSLRAAGTHDAVVLALGRSRAKSAFDWVMAASSKKETRNELEIRATGQAQVSNANSGKLYDAQVDGQVRYVFTPETPETAEKEDPVLARVRGAVSGKRALLMGGPCIDFSEAQLDECLGLAGTTFLPHEVHAQNIRRAKQMLHQGDYGLFVVFIDRSTHNASDLKRECPAGCIYVQVTGRPTIVNLLRSLTQVHGV